MHSKHHDSRLGQVAVETALILPLFLILLMGIIDFSRYYWTQSIIRGAANEGVRMAILDEVTDSKVMDTVSEELVKGGVTETPDIQVGERLPNEPVEVRVAVPFSFAVIHNLIPGLEATRNVVATAVMTHER